MSSDAFASFGDDVDNPARKAFAVVPSDATEIAILPRALIIGNGGDLTLRAVDSPTDVTITVLTGMIVPIRASFVRATGTTASGIVGLA